jgi:hypothetical protein
MDWFHGESGIVNTWIGGVLRKTLVAEPRWRGQALINGLPMSPAEMHCQKKELFPKPQIFV